MKKIGLVGGTGPESTLMYYKELNNRIDKMTGGAQMPDLAIESVNFRKAWDYVSNGKYDSLTDYLAEKVEKLKAGCTELPLILNKNNCPVDCLDSVEIHLQKLIELARD